MNLTLRPGAPEDAFACGTIIHKSFREIAEHHNFPPDFTVPEAGVGVASMLLNRSDVRCTVAELGGRVVGSNFLWGPRPIAGIGPITIDPSCQNSRIGRQLMEDALEHAAEQGYAGVRLVQAAYHNRSLCLYAKLGFDIREPLAAMQGAAIKQEIPGFAVRAAMATDLRDCDELCRKAHGFERGAELRQALAQGSAAVVERGGRISGYTTLIGYFGHAVGESNDDLKALIAATSEIQGPGFLLPTRNGELFRWCLGQGLRVVHTMTLMSTGLYNEPSRPFLPSILY